MAAFEQSHEQPKSGGFKIHVGDRGFQPTRGSIGSAGWDLFAAEDVEFVNGRAIVPTDLTIELPVNTYGRIAPRSGLAAKHSIDVGAGVIDRDYRGKIGVVLFKIDGGDFKISRGDRIAQLVIERICTDVPMIVGSVDELMNTARGEGGFGSTGK